MFGIHPRVLLRRLARRVGMSRDARAARGSGVPVFGRGLRLPRRLGGRGRLHPFFLCPLLPRLLLLPPLLPGNLAPVPRVSRLLVPRFSGHCRVPRLLGLCGWRPRSLRLLGPSNFWLRRWGPRILRFSDIPRILWPAGGFGPWRFLPSWSLDSSGFPCPLLLRRRCVLSSRVLPSRCRRGVGGVGGSAVRFEYFGDGLEERVFALTAVSREVVHFY